MPPLEQHLHTPETTVRHAPAARSDAQALIRTARARLRPLLHPPEHYEGIGYYDDEFDMAQSRDHSEMIYDLGQFLRQVAAANGLMVFTDNPIWYWVAETEQQKAFYPDYALAQACDSKRCTALNLLLAIELVSTATAAKEQKDSVRMRDLNAANGVPEFALFYPELDDERALRWFSLDEVKGGYREWVLPADRRYRSQAIPGMEVEVLPPEAWQPGRKARLWYRGDRLPAMNEAIYLAEQATQQAEQASQQAKQERQARETAERQAERQAEQAQAETERLLARLREAGLAT